MKELPATLVMRPFNFDTLATQAYTLASDERLAEASTAALAIVAVGLLPLIALSRQISRAQVHVKRPRRTGRRGRFGKPVQSGPPICSRRGRRSSGP
jgi:hypothetical protein